MKLVSNQISPNLKAQDVFAAIFKPVNNTASIFEQYFCTKNYLLANSARTCLGVIADVVNPDPQKKIGLPAFICGVVATPFLQRGYKIEWIDTDENGLIDPADFAAKSSNIGLLVVPHVFGHRAPLEKIMEIAKPQSIFVVEDGAHLIRQLEPHFKFITDAQILSFGREKVVSCVSGGALLWPEDSPFAQAFSDIKLAPASFSWTLRHLSQPVIFSSALPWWQKGGKLIPYIFRKLNWLPLAVSAAEKKGQEDFPQSALPRSLQKLLVQQFQNYELVNVHAQALALKWEAIFKPIFKKHHLHRPASAFRFVLKSLDKTDVKKLKKVPNYHLEDWDGLPISPRSVDLQKFGYRKGSCPNAEYFAQTHVTFPTNKRVNKRDINVFAKIWQDT